jgi:murein DD-endopeptidase MepM/ murein hydrolase activator NlpD
MFELFKILFGLRDRSVQLIIVDPEDTSKPKEVFFQNQALKKAFYLLFSISGILIFLLLILVILRWTAGGDARIRSELNMMANRVNALNDSIIARDVQLMEIKQLFRNSSTPITSTNTSSFSRPTVQQEPRDAEVQTMEFRYPDEWDKMGRMVGIRPGIRQSRKETISRDLFPAQLPLNGSITRTYMPEIGHIGLDIAVREGTPIRSFAQGVVINADWTLPYGFVVSILHGQDVIVTYKHLKDTRIVSGDRIQKGEEIGLIGQVGFLSTGPHLHLEIWKEGTHVDPMLYFIFN